MTLALTCFALAALLVIAVGLVSEFRPGSEIEPGVEVLVEGQGFRVQFPAAVARFEIEAEAALISRRCPVWRTILPRSSRTIVSLPFRSVLLSKLTRNRPDEHPVMCDRRPEFLEVGKRCCEAQKADVVELRGDHRGRPLLDTAVCFHSVLRFVATRRRRGGKRQANAGYEAVASVQSLAFLKWS